MVLFQEDPEDEGTRFEPYDLKMLIGYALIAFAFSMSLNLSTFLTP